MPGSIRGVGVELRLQDLLVRVLGGSDQGALQNFQSLDVVLPKTSRIVGAVQAEQSQCVLLGTIHEG